ncbi:hypothetical protein HELRODRAFT_172516 [Helobdella robusta]|uniref:Uncharacterized protein n=1 Tax=Helobdella robusta TaxID=6412 RepID=T1F5F9_HELRO|nr:hypothetical protein HELRODRAFT_172514 [Helobdella robusta]XP_009017442.1 hypothetical protein HELRODRAFT_172516 [Helobdella robusta]ESO04171.1 hypothetical protein HELRODRAFT_172514 [Helobdella robusta]ESO04173.1 hypothetical protein HELRODRAFT_172516 [Helobdella robusta]
MEGKNFSSDIVVPTKKTEIKKKCPIGKCKFTAVNYFHLKFHIEKTHGIPKNLVSPICEKHTCVNNTMLKNDTKNPSKANKKKDEHGCANNSLLQNHTKNPSKDNTRKDKKQYNFSDSKISDGCLLARIQPKMMSQVTRFESFKDIKKQLLPDFEACI